MNIYIEILLFILGVAFGSFLLVFLGRYDPDKDRQFFSKKRIQGRSRCDSCGIQLRWFELVPIVSYLVQGGKCRYCKSKISSIHFMMEIIVGIIFVSVPLVIKRLFILWFPLTWFWLYIILSIIWILVVVALVSVFYIDKKYSIIPNELNFFLFVLGIIWVVILEKFIKELTIYKGSFLHQYVQMFPILSRPWMNGILGMLFGGILFFLIVYLSGGKAMGVGDIKLIAPLGLLFGWPDIFLIVALSFIIGALYSVVLMIFKKSGLKDMIPFGPFIVISAFIVFYFGAGLMSLYFAIISV